MPSRRVRLTIQGVVQGVGFRPFVHELAGRCRLAGWVRNTPQGLTLEVEGDGPQIEHFLTALKSGPPPPGRIDRLVTTDLDPSGLEGFRILNSEEGGGKTAVILPDLGVCAECLAEIDDPRNLRYRYPFTNCTHCGPRFSIIRALPYDRANTTMQAFVMCPRCKAEYLDPADRRFHAQPNACPDCGPQLELWDADGGVMAAGEDAVGQAVAALRAGKIVAVKGLGGFHLMADAGDDAVVLELRRRKQREAKPLALMVSSMAAARNVCVISAVEEGLLRSAAAPIVLLRRRTSAAGAAPSVAPGQPCLGVMLPYTPLHHLMLRGFNGPVVATSGNLSDEPICIDEHDALSRLAGIADVFLVHNRPIERPVDDSVVRVVAGRPLMLRRSRGYAPLPVPVPAASGTVLAVGGQMKNTVALKVGGNIFLSQHTGDLHAPESLTAFRQAVDSLIRVYEPALNAVACDCHPDYAATREAREFGVRVIAVQHHYAHVVSCLADNGLDGPVLGLAWDGTGFGLDGTVWGGEFLRTDAVTGFERVACLRPFLLPGGERAVTEARRVAFALLSDISDDLEAEFGDLPCVRSLPSGERKLLRRMMAARANTPVTTSMGRLFDGAAALLDLCQTARFEGEAAMAMEAVLDDAPSEESYPYVIHPGPLLILDWRPIMAGLAADVRGGGRPAELSAKFHNTLVEAAVDIVRRINEKKVVLSGGCFQNKYLTERTVQRLREEGFEPYWHRNVPPNDGGLSLGQAVAAAARLSREHCSGQGCGMAYR